jgi:large subunit ribosomal protein L13
VSHIADKLPPAGQAAGPSSPANSRPLTLKVAAQLANLLVFPTRALVRWGFADGRSAAMGNGPNRLVASLKPLTTTFVRKEDADRRWYVVDADAQIVGRLATRLATVLMGKHKPQYTPHVDCGDFVIVLNAEKVRFSGKALAHREHANFTTKMARKVYDRYTGYPGGRRFVSGGEMLARHPERIISEAVRRMLPKNKLGKQMLKKLKVYAGTEHPHQSQQPQAFPAHLMPPQRKAK